MKALCGIFDSWSHCISQFCQPVTFRTDEKSYGHDDFNDNSFSVIHEQPSFMPRPSAAPLRNNQETFRGERAPRKRQGLGWSGFSARKQLFPSTTSLPRRPRISPPTDFRHVYSESFHIPESTTSQLQFPPTTFRPLELSLDTSATRLSPAIPHINHSGPPVTPPPRAYTVSPKNLAVNEASHQRSNSAMSFNIPRRPVNGGSVFDSPRSNTSTPQRPSPVKTRGYASPSPPPPPIMEDLVERVANAMLERDKLQEQIDDIVEKQSVYTNSRPSTAHEQPGLCLHYDEEPLRQRDLIGMAETEPMPEMAAMPPNAPSFSERLSSDHVQSTSAKAPTRPRYQANSSRKIEGRVPPPPLPLRLRPPLRPPLRKKKSFSRVSNWLYPAEVGHRRDISYDSITNAPKAVTADKGFYQVAPQGPTRRSSFDSESSVSDWTVEEQTLVTSLSPSSVTTPRVLAGPPTGSSLGLQDAIQFQHRKGVGIAF
jgi:hypothetical protein